MNALRIICNIFPVSAAIVFVILRIALGEEFYSNQWGKISIVLYVCGLPFYLFRPKHVEDKK